MANTTFESFLDPSTMFDAQRQLLKKGADAIPELHALLSGESKNQFGIPYRDLGMPLRCALEVAIRLGPIARPLEPFLRLQLDSGDETAARALGALGVLELASVHSLTSQLDRYPESISMEAARALIQCGCVKHPLVVEACKKSKVAMNVLERICSLEATRSVHASGLSR